jgi:hypothetical protein
MFNKDLQIVTVFVDPCHFPEKAMPGKEGCGLFVKQV